MALRLGASVSKDRLDSASEQMEACLLYFCGIQAPRRSEGSPLPASSRPSIFISDPSTDLQTLRNNIPLTTWDVSLQAVEHMLFREVTNVDSDHP